MRGGWKPAEPQRGNSLQYFLRLARHAEVNYTDQSCAAIYFSFVVIGAKINTRVKHEESFIGSRIRGNQYSPSKHSCLGSCGGNCAAERVMSCLNKTSLLIFFFFLKFFRFRVFKSVKNSSKSENLLPASGSAALDSGALNHLDVLMIWVSDQKMVSAVSPLVIAGLGA